MKRGFEDKLIIDGTSYNDQGEYVCEAVNMIAGRRNTVQSGPVKMEVRGKFYMRINIYDYLSIYLISKILQKIFNFLSSCPVLFKVHLKFSGEQHWKKWKPLVEEM